MIQLLLYTKPFECSMKVLIILSILYLTLAAPAQLVKFTVSSYILPDKSLEMSLDVVVPKRADSYPLIVFVTGLSGLMPSYFLSELIDSIAEQGYAFASVSKLQSPNPQKVTHALQTAINWIDANLQSSLNTKVPGVIADIDNRFILMGHSAGGHVVTQYLNGTCGKVKMQILLDPVDGTNPYKKKQDFIITPGKFLPYATPVLVMESELDHVKKDLVEPACAPENVSNTRFYNAMSGPKWFLNVSKYGHIDFLNNEYRELSTVACSTCHKNCTFSEYRKVVKEIILSFIDAILYADQYALEIIQNAKFEIPTTFKHDYMKYNPKGKGFCVRKPQQQQNIAASTNVNLKQQ